MMTMMMTMVMMTSMMMMIVYTMTSLCFYKNYLRFRGFRLVFKLKKITLKFRVAVLQTEVDDMVV